MKTSDAATEDFDSLETKILRFKVRLLLLIPWPLLYFGYWSLSNVKGPASEGFGMGGYASAISSTAYGIILYALNRAIVYSRTLPRASSEDRALYGIALFLFVAGILGLLPMLFFFMLGFPYSILGIILIVISLLRWKAPARSLNKSFQP